MLVRLALGAVITGTFVTTGCSSTGSTLAGAEETGGVKAAGGVSFVGGSGATAGDELEQGSGELDRLVADRLGPLGHAVPDNPPACILRTARNLALDVVRREQVFRNKEPEIIRLLEDQPGTRDVIFPEHEIADDRLRMMFVCCHPLIPAEAQTALALKTLCGFSAGEIARAFLTTEAAVAKRLVRARQKIAEADIPFAIPAGPELAPRLDGVLRALYLLFNEGYKASAGEQLVREEVCAEAIRLAELLAAHPCGDQPRTHALLALMLLNAARTPARVDDNGDLLRLREQDRTRWDPARLARGMLALARSAAGSEVSEYHLQAAVAACHGRAKDYAATDWPQILALYDRLLALNGSPVVALNRALRPAWKAA